MTLIQPLDIEQRAGELCRTRRQQRLSEQFSDRLTFAQQIERTALAVGGFEIFNTHGVIHRFGDIRWSNRFIGWVLAKAVAGTVRLPALDSATSHHVGQTVSPVIAAGP